MRYDIYIYVIRLLKVNNKSFRIGKNGVAPAVKHGDRSRPQHLLRSCSEIQSLSHENT